MRKTFAGAITVAVVGLTAGGGLLAASPSPAHADHPGTVCSYWGGEADSFHVRVDWLAGRSFRVAITDFTLVSQPNPTGDAFVPLPLEPNLRVGTNTVELGDGLAVSDVSISQAVALEPAGTATDEPIANYLRLEPAPWERVDVGEHSITWLQDIDARSDERGSQVTPQAGGKAAELKAASAGVLDFTLTVPDAAAGEVVLFSGLTSSHTDATFNSGSGVWVPGAPHALTVAGCSVTVEPVERDTGAQAPAESNVEGPPEPQGQAEREHTEPDAHAPSRGDAAATPDDNPDQDRATPEPSPSPPPQGSKPEEAEDPRIARAGSPSALLTILIAGGAAILGMTLIAGSRQRL